MPTSGDVSKFFDETLAEMVEHSPAVQQLDPALRILVLETARNGSLEKRKNILRALLKEAHSYVEIAQRLQKKYGFRPEEYVQKLENWFSKSLYALKEGQERIEADESLQWFAS